MSHYSLAQKPKEIVAWSNIIAEKIKTQFDSSGIMPVLIYSGMSGIASATSISHSFYNLCGKNLYMVYVRKQDERSHGSNIEYEKLNIENEFFNYNAKIHEVKCCLIFVDDFICTGETIARCIKGFNAAKENGLDGFHRLEVGDILISTSRHESITSYTDSPYIGTLTKRHILKCLKIEEAKPISLSDITISSVEMQKVKSKPEFFQIDSIPSFKYPTLEEMNLDEELIRQKFLETMCLFKQRKVDNCPILG